MAGPAWPAGARAEDNYETPFRARGRGCRGLYERKCVHNSPADGRVIACFSSLQMTANSTLSCIRLSGSRARGCHGQEHPSYFCSRSLCFLECCDLSCQSPASSLGSRGMRTQGPTLRPAWPHPATEASLLSFTNATLRTGTSLRHVLSAVCGLSLRLRVRCRRCSCNQLMKNYVVIDGCARANRMTSRARVRVPPKLRS